MLVCLNSVIMLCGMCDSWLNFLWCVVIVLSIVLSGDNCLVVGEVVGGEVGVDLMVRVVCGMVVFWGWGVIFVLVVGS